MVLLAHLPFSSAGLDSGASPGFVYPPRAISNVLALGHYGVQLFLVISGYCIHMRWARGGDRASRLEFSSFWRRRFLRLYPPYLVVLAASLVTVVLGHQVGPGSSVSLRQLGVDLACLLLLVQNVSAASIHIGNPALWSLALEEHLYLLYFPLLFLRRSRGWPTALIVSFATFIGWLLLGGMLRFDARWEEWHEMAFGYWFCWALGALAAEGHVSLVKLPGPLSCFALFAVGLALSVVTRGMPRDFLVTTSFFALVVAVTELEDSGLLAGLRGAAALARLGTISYGVYLVHSPVFVVTKRVLVALGAPVLAVLGLRFASGLVAGYLLFRLVESPFQARSQKVRVRLIRDRRLPEDAASAP